MASVSPIFNLGKIMLSMVFLVILILPTYAADSGIGRNPQIMIMGPKENTTLSAGNVTITANVTNFNLVPKYGQRNVLGEGHIHYYFDVPVPRTIGKPAVTAAGTFVPIVNESWTWPNVKPGKHNFSVQLANNDHTPLIPLVFDQVNVTVTSNSKMDAKSVTIGLTAQNIAFNTSTITVPAGSNVTVLFNNMDRGVAHNLAVYETSAATKTIFLGNIFNGPKMMAYNFMAPADPGAYFFRCDVHPVNMYGKFIVT